MEIKVTRTVHAELERVKWRYCNAEDYYVRAGDKSQMIGMISIYPDYVLGLSAWLKPHGWNDDRKFTTREAAVAALVRFAAKHGVI